MMAARPFLVLSCCSAVAALTLGVVTVPLGIGAGIDEEGFGRVTRRYEPTLYHAMHRFLGGIGAFTLSVIAISVLLVALRRRQPVLAVAAIAVVLGSNITTQALKVLTERRIVGDPWDQSTAFPSGHATMVLSLAVAATLVVPPRWRWTATVVGGLFATLVSGALLAVNWHRPSEIVGAYLVVSAWAGAAIAGVLIVDSGVLVTGEDSGDRGVVSAVVAVVMAITILVATLPIGDVYSKATAREGFATATAVCALVAFAVLSVTTVLLQHVNGATGVEASRRLGPAPFER